MTDVIKLPRFNVKVVTWYSVKLVKSSSIMPSDTANISDNLMYRNQKVWMKWSRFAKIKLESVKITDWQLKLFVNVMHFCVFSVSKCINKIAKNYPQSQNLFHSSDLNIIQAFFTKFPKLLILKNLYTLKLLSTQIILRNKNNLTK